MVFVLSGQFRNIFYLHWQLEVSFKIWKIFFIILFVLICQFALILFSRQSTTQHLQKAISPEFFGFTTPLAFLHLSGTSIQRPAVNGLYLLTWMYKQSMLSNTHPLPSFWNWSIRKLIFWNSSANTLSRSSDLVTFVALVLKLPDVLYLLSCALWKVLSNYNCNLMTSSTRWAFVSLSMIYGLA